MGAESSKDDKEDGSKLDQPLTKQQIEALDPTIRQQLEKYQSEQKSLFDGMKINSDRYQAEAEAKISSLEQKYKDDVSRLEADAKLATDLRLQTADLEKKYNEMSLKYREIQSKYFTKDQYWNERETALLHDKEVLQTEKNDLLELLEKRNNEIDRLTEEWRQMSEKYNENNRIRISAETSAGEAKSECAILQHRESRLKMELEQIKEQHRMLTEQLHESCASVLDIRREKATTVIELQNRLDESIQQVTCLEQSLEECRKSQTEQSKQIESYMQKLRDGRQSHADMEERYRSELTAQDRLINLYKSSTTEAEAKVEELTTAVKELQQLLGKANDAYSHLEEEKDAEIKELRQSVDCKESKIEELESELKSANVLLEASRKRPAVCLSDEEVEMISPAAAAASRMLKSGMTLTQIYSEYVSVVEELQTVKEENKHLSEDYNNIMEEVKEEAPKYTKLKKDYERACSNVAHLDRQNEAALREVEKYQAEAEAIRRKNGELSRENERLEKSLADCGLQVRLLLKELEEARGAVVSMSTDDDTLYSDLNTSSASNIISDRLVTFRSIEELQRNNEKLLAVVRELSESQETRERETTNERAEQLQQELDKAMEEIEELVAARRRQTEIVESIIQQRDMYKEMAESRSASKAATPSAMKSPPVQVTSPVKVGLSEQEQKILEQTKNSLAELQEQFSTYRKERSENERMLNEQLEVTQQQASELRVKNAMLASQVEFAAERFKILNGNTESRKKEIDVLRQRSEGLSEQVIKYQQAVALLREEAKSTREKLAQAEVRVQTLTTEKERYKCTEQMLNKELEDVRREQQSRDLLLSNLHTIQNNMERSDFELKVKFTQRIEALEKENIVLRKRAEGTDEQQKAFVITLERQLSEARDSAESERQKCARIMEQLDTANSHVEHLQDELNRTEALVTASEAKLETFKKQKAEGSSSIQELEDANKKLLTLEHELQGVKEKLEQSQQSASQYKEMARGLEETLQQQNEASQHYRQEKDAEITELNQARDTLEELIRDMEEAQRQQKEENSKLEERNTALQQEVQVLNEEKSQWKTSVDKSDSELMQQLEEARRTLSEAKLRCAEAVCKEEAARKDCQAQAAEAKEAIAKYERELVHHATDVEMLTSLKQQMEGFNDRLAEAHNETEEARNTLSVAQASWAEQEKILRRELNTLQEKVTGLVSQNNLLHDELQQVSEQTVQMQKKMQDDDIKTKELADSLAKEDQPKSSEKLQEVIRYLRREKEIAEARYDSIEAETNRLRQQTVYLKQQLETSDAALAKEREAAQVHVQTAAQHAELMRKVETLNLLQDSNRLLREDRNKTAQQLQEAEHKINELEAELSPLKEMTSELSSEKESLQQEIELLHNDISRWKARTNQLIEQCNKTDPEEFKRALEERDQMKRQLAAGNEEIKKLRTEIGRLGAQLNSVETSLNAEIEQLREQSSKLENELAEAQNTAKAAAEASEAEDEEKNKTIAQLRKIGRKYRMQAEDVQKELDTLRAETNVQQAGDLAALRDQIKLAETSLAEAQAEVERYRVVERDMTTKLEAAQAAESQSQEQCARLREDMARLAAERSLLTEEKNKMMSEKTKLEEHSSSVSSELNQKNEEVQTLTADKEKLSKEVTDLQTKLTQIRQLFVPSKQKMQVQKAEIDQLTAENNSLKERIESESKEKENIATELSELRKKTTLGSSQSTEEVELKMTSLRSQYEGKISRLERELTEARTGSLGQNNELVNQLRAQLTREQEERAAANETLEKVKRERQELQSRVNILQRQVENLQRQNDQLEARTAQATPASSADRTVVGSSESGPLRRANIRPIATPQSNAGPVRHAHATPVRPVRSSLIQTSGSGAATNLRAVDPRVSQSVPVQPVRTTPVTSAGGSSEEGAKLVQPVRTLLMSSGTSGVGGSAGTSAASDDLRGGPSGRQTAAEAWAAESRTTSVQPVRSGATEAGRAMVASIRPMAAAAAQQQLQQQQFTPMATVMPSISVQDTEGLPPSALGGVVGTVQQQVAALTRPTQQVQPVSSHVEESTVSSSEEQWRRPTDPLIPSTSRSSALSDQPAVSTAGATGTTTPNAKRQREECRPIQDESVETESEAPPKRSKIQMSEVSDTSHTSGTSVADVDREALSVVEQHQDSGRRASHEGNNRREAEPVSTSLSGMDDQHADMGSRSLEQSNQSQQIAGGEGSGALPPGEDLPDYQEPEASEPSTSQERGSGVSDVDELSNQGQSEATANRSEEDQANSGDAGMNEGNEEIFGSGSGQGVESNVELMGEDEEEDDIEGIDARHDVHFIDDDDDDEEADNDGDIGTEYKQRHGREEEAGEDDEDIYGDLASDAGPDVAMQGDASDDDVSADQEQQQQPQDDDDNDDVVIILDDDIGQGSQSSTAESSSPVESFIQQQQGQSLTTSQRGSNVQHMSGRSELRAGVVQQRPLSQPDRMSPAAIVGTSRAQLMPFIFGQADIGGSGFEFGDDGIVPSTPTLHIPTRTDGFAEAISSPQIREPFTFASASDIIPQSELMHQGGVDVTRMDLSQFDPAALASGSTGEMSTAAIRQSLAATSANQSAAPRITISDVSVGAELEEVSDDRGEGEEEQDQEAFQGYEEEGEREEEEGEREAEAQDHQSSSMSGYHLVAGSSSQEDLPSTSEGSDSQAPAKPKIQKIVWSSEQSSSSGAGPSAQSSGVTAIRRGFRRGGPRESTRPFRGGTAGRGTNIRPLVPGMLQQLQQQQLQQSPMQMARRSRGSRGPSNMWSSRPHF